MANAMKNGKRPSSKRLSKMLQTSIHCRREFASVWREPNSRWHRVHKVRWRTCGTARQHGGVLDGHKVREMPSWPELTHTIGSVWERRQASVGSWTEPIQLVLYTCRSLMLTFNRNPAKWVRAPKFYLSCSYYLCT
jgi:hypothetical protein